MPASKATTLPDGQLLIPQDLYLLLRTRMAEFAQFYEKYPDAAYQLEAIQQLPFMLKSAQVQCNGDVLVSDATRRFLARCMHDFAMTFIIFTDSGTWVENELEQRLAELDRRLGVQRVGELMTARDSIVAEERARWNLLKVAP